MNRSPVRIVNETANLPLRRSLTKHFGSARLNHRPMARDACLQDFIYARLHLCRLHHPALPTSRWKKSRSGIAGEALRLDRFAHRFDIDRAVPIMPCR
jgi:hypothetical protein